MWTSLGNVYVRVQVGGGGQSRGSAIPRETETSMSWLSKMTFAAIDWPVEFGSCWCISPLFAPDLDPAQMAQRIYVQGSIYSRSYTIIALSVENQHNHHFKYSTSCKLHAPSLYQFQYLKLHDFTSFSIQRSICLYFRTLRPLIINQ